MILNNAGYRIWKEPWLKNPEPVQAMAAPIPIEPHIQNFLDCVKSRQGAERAGGGGRQRGDRAAPGERGVPPGPPRADDVGFGRHPHSRRRVGPAENCRHGS